MRHDPSYSAGGAGGTGGGGGGLIGGGGGADNFVFMGIAGCCFLSNAMMMSAIKPKKKPNTAQSATERPLLLAISPQITAIRAPPMMRIDGLNEDDDINIGTLLADSVSDHTPRMTRKHGRKPYWLGAVDRMLVRLVR